MSENGETTAPGTEASAEIANYTGAGESGDVDVAAQYKDDDELEFSVTDDEGEDVEAEEDAGAEGNYGFAGTEEEVAAATRIQSIHRGRAARKTVDVMGMSHEADDVIHGPTDGGDEQPDVASDGDGEESEGRPERGSGIVPRLELRSVSRADLVAGPDRSARHKDWTVAGVAAAAGARGEGDAGSEKEAGADEADGRPPVPRVPVTGPRFNKRVKNIFAAAAAVETARAQGGSYGPGAPFQATSMTEQSPLLFSPRRDLDRTKRREFEAEVRNFKLNHQMHEAALDMNFSLVYQLTLRGADLAAPNDDGETLVHVASKDPKFAKHLRMLVKQVDVNAQDKDGRTALHAVVAARNLQALPILLEHGASPDIKNANGSTPLHEAASLGYVAIVDAFVKQGASVDIQDARGYTALHHAALCSRDCVLSLTANGAELHARTRGGYTPLDLAQRVKHHETMATLQDLVQPGSTVASKSKTMRATVRA